MQDLHKSTSWAKLIINIVVHLCILAYRAYAALMKISLT